MRAAGVIVEFNPLHNGHIEHLRETVRLTRRERIVAVMSGNFVQRGEPAICDKWRRTLMALLSGVDIVIELPVSYVVSGADYFSRAAVKLLAATGVVDKLCFGSESGDLALIKEAGRVLAYEPDEYKAALKDALNKGMSFAAARGSALSVALGDVSSDLLTKPNNGLGMEYCKALWQMGWPMEVFTSFRKAGGPSATAIRRVIRSIQETTTGFNQGTSSSELDEKIVSIRKMTSKHVSSNVLDIVIDSFCANQLVKLDDYSDIFRYLLFTKGADMGEGLENRFRNLAYEHRLLTALLDAVKTKRYTYTRIQRAALGIILGICQADLAAYEAAGGPAYIRVLGFKRGAADLLREMTYNATLPVITHGKAMDELEGLGAAMLAKEFEAGDIYQLAYGGASNYRHERSIPLVVID